MSTVQDLFQEAQIAEASYANFLDTAGNLLTDSRDIQNTLVASGFSSNPIDPTQSTQATAFLQNWRPVSQFSERGGLLGDGSGFSATLFERLDANQQRTGQYTFGIAGSTSFSDFVADANLATGGVALQQVLSMVNYVLRLRAGSGGTTRQVELPIGATAPMLSTGYVNGVGPGINVTELTISGHSLGGFLGQVYQRIFGSAGVFTFNALGIIRSNAPIFGQLADLLESPPGSFSSGPGENLLVPGDPAHLIGTVQGKPQIQVFSETQSITTEPFNTGRAHKIGYLTDSLALYGIFASIDSTLDTNDPAAGIEKITSLLKAASNRAAETLERTVNALVKFFDLDFVPLTGALTDDREALYQRVVALKALTPNSSLTVDDLTAMAATDLASIAQGAEGLAYRYALKNLNPFAIVGDNDLYTVHNANGELDRYNPNDGTGTLTTHWIADRAKFLSTTIGINSNDQLFALNTLDPAASKNTWYRDVASGENAYVLTSSGRGLRTAASIEAFLNKTEAERVFFGLDSADPGLTGGANADSLYGNGGDDRLSGLGGDDYLQGDAGKDKLYGGAGDDMLVGGKDDDLLNGGGGADTYVWNTGDGSDTIVDSDGVGKIVFAGQDLGGTYEQKGTDPKTFGNAEFTLTWNGKLSDAGSPEGTGWLTIGKGSDASGKLRIVGFDSAVTFLGIKLNGVPSTQVFTNLDGTDANDTLSADSSFERIYGLDGNDWITVSTAGAEAYGGMGADYITNGTGDQKLYGDAGNDILVASDGNDELYGGADNDAL